MASHRSHDRDDRSRQQNYDRDGNMYDDEHYEPQNERSAAWSRHTSSHGHSRTPPQRERRWDSRARDHNSRPETLSEEQGIQIRGRATGPNQHAPRGYQDRDREGYRSPQYRSHSRNSNHGRSRSRSRSYSPNPRGRSPRRNGPGYPSKEVMLDGLSVHQREEDITHELKKRYDVGDLENVRVIRDKRSGESRGFGFIRFASVDAAQVFIDANFPNIYFSDRNPTDAKDQEYEIRIAYSRERESRPAGGGGEGDWTCAACAAVNFSSRKACFKCGSAPQDMAQYQFLPQQQAQFLNNGDSDAAMQGPPSQFLLVRGLEPNVTEELLARGVSKLLKPGASSQGNTTAAKKGKVSSTTNDANLGAREGSIRRVFLVRDRQSNETWRYGFAEFATVDDAQAAITRFNSFDRFTISSKPVNVSYIHTGVFVPIFEQIEESHVFSPLGNTSIKLRYWNDYAYTSELTVTRQEDDLAVSEADLARSAADAAAAAAHKEGLMPVNEETAAKAKKRKVEIKDKETANSKKTTPSHLQFWSNRHAELHGIKPNAGDKSQETAMAEGTVDANETPSKQSYADPKKNCCYLCSRQFKTTAEVNKHERLSQLHRDNLLNDDLKRKAIAKLEKAGLPVVASDASNEDSSQYRDRARERRQAFGPTKFSMPTKKAKPDSEPEAVRAESPPAPSKGAALLGKMGWSSGEGLGAKGEGSKEAITTNVYAAGVGLGAEGGKLGDAVEEAAKNSKNDYRAFVQTAKDKAKARYESMS